MKYIAVIGGGASGLIAACLCSGKNNRVVLFEKQKALGRKILVTGNGRCNITNRNMDASHYHGHNAEFAGSVLGQFGLAHTIDFFRSIGVPFAEGERGRLYPASLQASTITKVFEYELHKRGVDVRLHRKIEKIIGAGNKIRLITSGLEEFAFDSVILAAGSCAYSPAGASRVGYELAASAGHKIYEPFPAILPLNINLKLIHKLEGIKWDCGVRVNVNGKIAARSEEELLFTKYGISGPASLEVSRAVNEAVLAGIRPDIIIDLFPKFSEQELMDILKNLWDDKEKTAGFCLLGILKCRMPQVILSLSGIDPEMTVKNLSEAQKKKIAASLKSIMINPGQPRPFSDAIVAAGGVDVDEVNPATMESKLLENFYITGELLDIDGDSGGYNLQFAWSTGAIAGRSQL